MIKLYIKYLSEEKSLSMSTVSAYIQALKQFLIFMFREYGKVTEITRINEYGELVKINLPEIKFKAKNVYYNKELSTKEINRILKVAKEKNERDYLLFLTLTTTGMRVSEALSLQVKDLKKLVLEITCKGRTRNIILPPSVKNSLKAFNKGKGSEMYLFNSTRTPDKPIDRKQAFTLFKKYGSLAHVKEEKCFPHNLRHSYTIMEIENGTDLHTLSEELGHRNINTLKIYQDRSESKKKKRMEKIAGKFNR